MFKIWKVLMSYWKLRIIITALKEIYRLSRLTKVSLKRSRAWEHLSFFHGTFTFVKICRSVNHDGIKWVIASVNYLDINICDTETGIRNWKCKTFGRIKHISNWTDYDSWFVLTDFPMMHDDLTEKVKKISWNRISIFRILNCSY